MSDRLIYILALTVVLIAIVLRSDLLGLSACLLAIVQLMRN